jgi:hypothetical protein
VRHGIAAYDVRDVAVLEVLLRGWHSCTCVPCVLLWRFQHVAAAVVAASAVRAYSNYVRACDAQYGVLLNDRSLYHYSSYSDKLHCGV